MRSAILMLLILILSGQALATDEVQSVLQQQVDAVNAEEILDALPKEAKERYDGFDHLMQVDLQEGIREILNRSLSGAGTGLRAALHSAGKLLAVALLCAIVRIVQEKSSGAVRIAGVLAVTLICAADLNTLVGLGRTTMEETAVFSAALLPVLSAATSASGAPASAAALYASTVFLTQLLNRLLLNVFLPLCHVCLACSCAELCLSDTLLKRMRKLLQNLLANGLKALLVCYSAYLALTGVVSGSADSATVKAAKLALSSVVPVVGSVIADASETVLVSASILRSSVGVFGLLGVLAVCVAPFLRLGVHYLTLKASSALAATVDDGALPEMMDAAAGVMGMILAMVGASALFNLIACVCFMKAVVPG
ncbi:MAG: hypothetical protein E7449_00230 [Ruminococcaceae bacterium]|nr:hypothetical protein [Oscillospiraceae bacterium]